MVGFSPWGHKELDTTVRLHFHFSHSCIEGNGNPLQCSCLENPRDRAWWAAIYGVAQSQTRLKQLSSSSSRSTKSGEKEVGLSPHRIVIPQRFLIVKIYQQDYVILYMILQLKVILILYARASVNSAIQKIVLFKEKNFLHAFIHLFYKYLVNSCYLPLFGTSF